MTNIAFYSRFILLAGVVSVASVGCSQQAPRTPATYAASAKKAYDAANVEFEAHNWAESQALFREVKRKYSYSRFAQLAELRIADANFEQGKFADALREYKQFVHDHRADEKNVLYARSRMAEAQSNEIIDSVLMPAGEERDQAPVLDAYKELRGFLHDYPDVEESKHVRELLSGVVGRLVRHELYVARFYLARAKFDATVSRINFALRNYIDDSVDRSEADSATLEPEALLLLGETYLKMHRNDDAMAAFNRLIERHPSSGQSVQAKNYIALIPRGS